MKKDLNSIFGDGGLLNEKLENYEYRPQQLEMADAVWKSIEAKHHLIVEAGTGVGKTLAYLIPFIFWSKENKNRVVISTHTKTLQEQIAKKDLPFLQEILPVEFKFALCLGSENYICLRRMNRYHQLELFDKEDTLEKIFKWEKETPTGTKLEIDFPVRDNLWQSICREPDLCFGKKCSYKNRCFYVKAKLKQWQADVLVVNHHLFFVDVAAGGRVLPKYEAIVFDEGQNIEEVAADHLGIEISNTGLNYILNRIYNPGRNRGLHRRLNISRKEKEQFIDGVAAVREESNIFFSELLNKLDTEAEVFRIREPDIIENTLESALVNLSEILKRFSLKTDDEETKFELKSYASRLIIINNGLNIIIRQRYNDYVYWADVSKKRRWIKISLYAAPINVAQVLKKTVFEKTDSIIITSATLAVTVKNPARRSPAKRDAGGFDFIKERLGLDKPAELLLDSPFDYKTQVLLYIQKNIPDPKYEPEEFVKKSLAEIEKIIKITHGRTFCLFTSYRMLNEAYDYLSGLNGYEIFKQGDIPKWQLLTEFKKGKNSVLLGTDTFWQGIDVPGKALECIIITRLPFAVPDEPLTEAKMEYLEKNGKDPFTHYQIPQAVIMFKQGFGRLIRHKKDVGIVAVLDPRIKTRGYGESFINSLPGCRNINTIEELETEYNDLIK